MSGEITVFSPGRICVIGEHVDYAGGCSLAAATPMGATLRAVPENGAGLLVESDRYDTVFDSHAPGDFTDWRRYIQAFVQVQGVALRGWRWFVSSDLPSGAGLSSSASLLVGLTLLAAACEGKTHDPMDTALLAQKVEREGVGVQVGLLDQLSVLYGQPGQLVDIHYAPCRVEPLVFPPDMGSFAIIHSGVKRELSGAGYNNRPMECQQALEILKQKTPGLANLASASEPRLSELPPLLRKRARHVITEVRRVAQARSAIRAQDAARLGELLNETHASLSEDFEVSLPQMDALVGALRQHAAVLGARMMGGGFGGGVICLLDASADEKTLAELVSLAATVPGISPQGWLTPPSAGATVTGS